MPAPTSPARRRRGLTWLAVLLTALVLTALSTAPAQAARHEVEIEQYAYGPSSLGVTQGDTVTWTNRDSVEHDVVVSVGPASFRSPLLAQGESWSYTFTTPGNYSYICSLHPDMQATVSARAVVAPPTTAAPTPTSTLATAPEAAPTTPGKRATTPSPSTAPAPAAPTPTQPAVTTTAPAAATTSTTLNPLLLVAGAAVAVVVFCLLLMASRPAYPTPPEPAKTDDET